MNLNQTNIRLLISKEPKSRENIYLYNGKIYEYIGEEGRVVEKLTDEFKETALDLSNLLYTIIHKTKDEEERKVLWEMYNMTSSLIEDFKRIEDEIEQLRFMVNYY